MTTIDRCDPNVWISHAGAIAVDALAVLGLATAIAAHAASGATIGVWVVGVLVVSVGVASLSGPGDLLTTQLPVIQAAGGRVVEDTSSIAELCKCQSVGCLLPGL